MKNLLSLLICLFVVSGCSSWMAATQPAEKDDTVLTVGTPRTRVIAELGSPVHSEALQDGGKLDVFKFTDGYKTSTRTARVIGHAIGSAFTLGLWELVGTSAEGAYRGEDIQVEIRYDAADNVQTTKVLKGAETFGADKTPPTRSEAAQK